MGILLNSWFLVLISLMLAKSSFSAKISSMKKSLKEQSNFRARYIYLALLVIAILASQSIIYSGYSVGIDAWPHFVRTKFVYDWLKQGEFPFFSFFFYSGYPALRFYSPLLYLIAGIFAFFLGGQVFWAMKLVLFLTNILSGFIFYWFLKEIGKDSFQSFLGAIVYLLIPWRIHYGAGIGTYPLFLIYLFLPFAFIALERLIKKPSLKNSIVFGLSLTLLILSHLIYALWSFLFLFLWFLCSKQWRTVLYGIPALFLAFFNSAFFLLPFILKYKIYTFPQIYEKLPPLNPLVLLGFLSETGGYTGFYLGLSVILLIGLAIYYRIRQKEIGKDMAIVGLILSLLLTFISAVLQSSESLLTAGLPPQRFLTFFVFFAGILIIDGYIFLRDKLFNSSIMGKVVPSHNPGGNAFYLLLLIIIFDCLPRAIFPAYEKKEELLGLRDEIYEILKHRPVTKLVDIDIPTEGIDIVKRVCKFPAFGFLFSNSPTVYGPPYHQFASKNMLYVYPWINSLADDLGDSTTSVLSDNSLKIIRLCGISHIITLPTLVGWGTDSTLVCLKDGLIWDNRFILAGAKPPLAIGEYPQNPLFLASNVKKTLPAEKLIKEKSFYIADDWQKVLEAIEINHEQGSCNFIPITEDSKAESLPGAEPEIKVGNFSISHHEITAELISSKECFIRVAASYYPELKVQIDENNLEPAETKDHFLTFLLPAGRHQIRIYSNWDIIDKYSLYLSLIAILFTLSIILLSRSQKQQSKTINKNSLPNQL